jgi:monoamine oxidase
MEAFQAYTADARTILERPWDIGHSWDKVLAADTISARERLDMLDLTPIQRTCMESTIASSAHNKGENFSYVEALRWFSLAGFNDFLMFMDAVARFSFKDGTISLINAMLDDGKPEVRLSTPVKSISDLGDKVLVTTTRGEEIKAATVISTLPMNVLPSVQFDPPLDAKVVEAGEERHTGQGVKFYAMVKGKHGKVFGLSKEDHPIATLFTYYEGDDHTLFAGFGIDREQIDYYDEEAFQEALRDYLPGAEVDSTYTYDWVLDPYSKGTYCSYKPGWMGKYYAHFQQDRGRVFFGSGDHGEGWRGFIDGAIGAGIKAAERVRQELG